MADPDHPAACSLRLAPLIDGPRRAGAVVGAGLRAAYLTFSAAELDVVALVGPDAVALPIAVQVPVLPPLRSGMPAVVGAGRVVVGGHAWRPARWWDPRPHVEATDLLLAAPRGAALVDALDAVAAGIGGGDAQAAVLGLVHGEAHGACSLLGAGPGFTPAGDDVVAGALAVLELTARLDPQARDAVLQAAVDRTTAVSAALLAAAARGDVVPPAARVLTALATGAPDDAFADAVAALHAVGGTSGRALLLGLCTALAGLVAPAAVREVR